MKGDLSIVGCNSNQGYYFSVFEEIVAPIKGRGGAYKARCHPCKTREDAEQELIKITRASNPLHSARPGYQE